MANLFGSYFLLINLLAFSLYYYDKRAARKNRRRLKESLLLLTGLLGGWPGALFAQRLFHHKTRKRSFQMAFWLSITTNIALLWLVYSYIYQTAEF